MQRRQKVGGILDRRFGENDPTMTPNEKALERFVKERQRGSKKGALFDLEDDDGSDAEGLTHLGQSLSLVGGENKDDFNEAIPDQGTDEEGESRGKKRRRLYNDNAEGDDTVELEENGVLERPKTKQEVMKEVIAKSKLHKYERQKAKEDDDELRAELDDGLSDIYNLMRGIKPQPKPSPVTEPTMNPDRAALLNGKDRAEADKEYDERIRRMALDARSAPTARTKTEEEIAEEKAQRLKRLEEQRLRRMRGEDSDEEESQKTRHDSNEGDEPSKEDEDILGIGKGIPAAASLLELDVEDEDEFLIDDIVASGSEENASEIQSGVSTTSSQSDDEEEMEFVKDLIYKDDEGREAPGPQEPQKGSEANNTDSTAIAFTYPCPQSHEELLAITMSTPLNHLPTIVQRIRALYHPKLNSENKAKMGQFANSLVDHIPYLTNQPQRTSFIILETLIRHVHSLAKSFPEDVGLAFRAQLKSIHQERPIDLKAGDFMTLTAIGSIFPTSDHFHQVVTPAALTMGRYLGQKIPKTLADLARGAYIGTLFLQWQLLSKRYIPEVVNYVLNSISIICPVKPREPFGPYPVHDASDSLRIGQSGPTPDNVRRIQFWDIDHIEKQNEAEDEMVKAALLDTNLTLISTMAEIWNGKSAFPEIFRPFSLALEHLQKKKCSSKLSESTRVSPLPAPSISYINTPITNKTTSPPSPPSHPPSPLPSTNPSSPASP